jgi:hypothetical protein
MAEECGEVIDGRHRPTKARDTQELGRLADDRDDLPIAIQTHDFDKANGVRLSSDSNGEEVHKRGARLGSLGERIVECFS